MKLITSKRLVILATIAFTTLVMLKFFTIQGMRVSDEEYHLYGVEGDKLFGVSNDGNDTFVEIFDESRVSLRGFFVKDGDRYRVRPYSLVDINDSNGSLTYRFVSEQSRKSFSFPVRFGRYELIGGEKFGFLRAITRLHKADKPLLMLFPAKGYRVFGKSNNGIRVVALQEGLTYLDSLGDATALPKYRGDIKNLLQDYKRGKLPLTTIANDGIISSSDQNLLLNLSITQGNISTKDKKTGRYKEVKTKYIHLREYNDFENISTLSLIHASPKYYVKRDDNQTYLNAPYAIPIDKKIVVKGRDALFGFDKYLNNADFSRRVPRLDKPKRTKKAVKVSRYYDFLNIDDMYGLYVSDEQAEVSYSHDKKRWIKAISNYKYAPPLYLYHHNIKGKFIAPNSFKHSKGKLYYKVRAKAPSYTLAFQGEIKIETPNGDTILKKQTTHREMIAIRNHPEVIIEATKQPLERCGVVLRLDEKRAIRYRFGDGAKRDFDIVDANGSYTYSIAEKLNPFRSYTLHIDGYKPYEYRPQLSCKYSSRVKKPKISSLYDKSNMLDIIPKLSTREAKKTTIKKADENGSRGIVQIPRELIPIYGDGVRFGLLSKGVSIDKLTIDKEFSLQVAQIFTDTIKPLLKNAKLQKRLKQSNEMIEGATAIIKIDEDGNREVLSLFSYPYPQGRDLKRELIIDALDYRHSTLKNRALDMLGPPGSTFKIVTSIALAREGKLDDFGQLLGRGDIYHTPIADGVVGFHLKNYTDPRGNTERTNYTDYIDAFTHSYNTYFGYAGLMLHHRLEKHYSDDLLPVTLDKAQRTKEFTLLQVANSLYFNHSIPLSKEHHIYARASHFPDTFIKAKDVADSAIGQYNIRATPLQMAVVTSIIYDNKLQLPSIIKDRETDATDEEVTEQKKETLLGKFISIFHSQDGLNEIQMAMRKVVTHGTARDAFKRFKKKQCKVYGKTGTAQKGKKGLYDGWFVSFTKGLREDIVIATVVKNSGTGATYAAPINRKIIEAWIAREKNN